MEYKCTNHTNSTEFQRYEIGCRYYRYSPLQIFTSLDESVKPSPFLILSVVLSNTSGALGSTCALALVPCPPTRPAFCQAPGWRLLVPQVWTKHHQGPQVWTPLPLHRQQTTQSQRLVGQLRRSRLVVNPPKCYGNVDGAYSTGRVQISET
jgi:hypothetical protein